MQRTFNVASININTGVVTVNNTTTSGQQIIDLDYLMRLYLESYGGCQNTLAANYDVNALFDSGNCQITSDSIQTAFDNKKRNSIFCPSY